MASLAPPSSSAPSKVHRNLETPRPQPASARPRKLPHQLPVWNLAKVPFRLFSPPKATGMVGSVRSLKATHMSDVRLADVIANKHLSPLSLKDFEVRSRFDALRARAATDLLVRLSCRATSSSRSTRQRTSTLSSVRLSFPVVECLERAVDASHAPVRRAERVREGVRGVHEGLVDPE